MVCYRTEDRREYKCGLGKMNRGHILRILGTSVINYNKTFRPKTS